MYCLKDSSKALAILLAHLKKGNKLQYIFISQFAAGKSENQILKQSRQIAIEQGLKPKIYSLPLGFHGHAAGTTLGMRDAQQGLAGSGAYPLHLNTAYAIELNNSSYIEQWGKKFVSCSKKTLF